MVARLADWVILFIDYQDMEIGHYDQITEN